MRRHRGAGGVAIANSRAQDAHSVAKAFDPSRPARPSPLAASTIRGIPLDLVERIRSFSVFSEAPEDFLLDVGACLRLQVHAAQESIINEGEEARAMYWLIRGSVVVTSRDRESIYAELPPGTLFGEIGILMNVPRTATVLARSKVLVARLNKEDLRRLLPRYPDVERWIREEAEERLSILKRKKSLAGLHEILERRPSKRGFGLIDEDADEQSDDVSGVSNKKIKSPSPPTMLQGATSTALGAGTVNVRQLLRKLPLFSELPDPFLHFLGLSAEPTSYAPFTTILEENTTGRDVYFITEGTVEVFNESDEVPKSERAEEHERNVRARLTVGQFFGEVTSLWLAPERTASVRAVDSVECLKVSGDVIDDLWRRCPAGLRQQVEDVARQRVQENKEHTRLQLRFKETVDSGTQMDIDEPKVPGPGEADEQASAGAQTSISFRNVSYDSLKATASTPEPFDPDPFSNTERPRRPGLSRRGSLANIPSESSPLAGDRRGSQQMEGIVTTLSEHTLIPPAFPKMSSNPASTAEDKGPLPDSLLELIFQHLDLHDLMHLRRVSGHWQRLLTRSPNILQRLDLNLYHRHVTDEKLIAIIAPFVATRPRSIDLSNCFHVTDEGFLALVASCSSNVTHWRLKSVWEISANSIIQMTNKSPNLISLDFSNCRKVSDHLLTRVVGWIARPSVAPPPLPQRHASQDLHQHRNLSQASDSQAPPTVIGCPKLRRLTLSYCKHVTDRFMAHLAHHASGRLEEMDLTRCTTISDNGFRSWADRPFPRLRKLVLADCTYLSDTAISCLAQSAKNLEVLDLSFCCALSDAAVEKVAASLPRIKRLDLAFCGSAVSDASMASIGRGLKELQELGVRGCVRVTSSGVEAVLAGCEEICIFDVSQCRNLVMDERWSYGKVNFNTVADGKWRVGR